ncbi:hypothetical protein NGRA_0643 [Nosema granulosis]|uniref:Uncharacterized protein n=1 Tax=Nosema granulosis TaxID=83296 RepID=A0A9P6KZV1_9MICR|nr:hypothetical protein NGRA_0643 [Nosema granulosis]
MATEEKFTSYLEKLYREQPEDIVLKIAEYVKEPKSLKEEVNNVKLELELQEADIVKSIFILEIVSKSIKTHKEFREYADFIVSILEKFTDYKYSIFRLRLIKSVINTRFYVPVSYYLFSTVKQTLEIKNLVSLNINVDYSNVKIKQAELKSEEIHMFIIKEFENLLMKHLDCFSNSIGFPELANVVIFELNNLKTGIFVEFFDRLISKIEKHKNYVQEERNKSKIDVLKTETVNAFEKNIKKMQS